MGAEGALGEEEDDGEGERGDAGAGEEGGGDGMAVGFHEGGLLVGGKLGDLLDAELEEAGVAIAKTPAEMADALIKKMK